MSCDRNPRSFVLIPAWIKCSGVLREMSPAEAKVYWVIASHAGGRSRKAWPSLLRLAAECNLSIWEVSRVVQKLWKRGLIDVVKNWKNNTYTVHRDSKECMSSATRAVKYHLRPRANDKRSSFAPTRKYNKIQEKDPREKRKSSFQHTVNNTIQNIIQVPPGSTVEQRRIPGGFRVD